jgi:hypothetical protein
MITSGGIIRTVQKALARVRDLGVKKSDPPLSKIRIKHYKGLISTLYISVGFRHKKVGLPTGD